MITKTEDKTNDVMSEMEKRVLQAIMPESEPLPYPTRTLVMSIGPDAEEYVIPEGAKGQVLRDLYPFSCPPDISETMVDIHENKPFRVGDFKVIREDKRNYLVSPYYAKSGGMVIDWISDEKVDSDGTVFLRNPEDADAPDAVIGRVQLVTRTTVPDKN